MNTFGIIVVCILILIFLNYLVSSHFNNKSVKLCDAKNNCDNYNVHAGHDDYNDAAFLMKEIQNRIDKLMHHLKNKYNINSKKTNEYINNRIKQLFSNYSNNNVFEISPRNTTGVTSYSDNKTKLILCMRKKEGKNNLHDINTMMFVVVHELAHIMNNRWGHTKSSNFWELFKFMLVNSIEIGIYQPVNYAIHPIIYCGLEITYSPIYDNSITTDSLY